MLSSLYLPLQKNLDNLARRFIDIYSLDFSEDIENLSSPVTRWLDFRMRYVSPHPRQVIYSAESLESFKTLPREIQKALLEFEEKVRRGDDINPYQGRGLKHGNDTSGTKSQKRTDQLWACWGILHFHLTIEPVESNGYFSKRSNYQVFCIFDDWTCAIIDVRRHPKKEGFSDPEFLGIAVRNWPEVFSHVDFTGHFSGKEMTSSQIHDLRKIGVNSVLTVEGKTFWQPGLGLTFAGTSLRQHMTHIIINRDLQALSEMIEKDPRFSNPINQTGINDPDFRLTITDQGFIAYEARSTIGFRFDNSFLPSLTKQLFPDWCIMKYLSSHYADEV